MRGDPSGWGPPRSLKILFEFGHTPAGALSLARDRRTQKSARARFRREVLGASAKIVTYEKYVMLTTVRTACAFPLIVPGIDLEGRAGTGADKAVLQTGQAMTEVRTSPAQTRLQHDDHAS